MQNRISAILSIPFIGRKYFYIFLYKLMFVCSFILFLETNQDVCIHVFCIYVHMYMNLIRVDSSALPLCAFLPCPQIVLVSLCVCPWSSSYDWKRGGFKNGAQSQLPNVFSRGRFYSFFMAIASSFLSLSLFPSFCQHIKFQSIPFCFQRITQLTDGQTKS